MRHARPARSCGSRGLPPPRRRAASSTAGAQAARAGTTETEPARTGGSRSAARGSAAVGARAAVGRTHFNIIEPRWRQGLSRRCQRGARSWQRDGQGSAIGTRHARFLRAGCFTILSGGRRCDGFLSRARAGARSGRSDRCALRRAACAAASHPIDLDDDDHEGSLPARHPPHSRGRRASSQPRPPRSYRGLAKLAVALIILAGLAGDDILAVAAH